MISTGTIIVGAGPIGIELAAALKQRGADYTHFEAHQIGHTISWFPQQVRFFSSSDRIAIAGIPLNTVDQTKATREQYLTYLRGVVEHYDLKVHTFESVRSIRKAGTLFRVQTDRRGTTTNYQSKHLVLAVGDMHRPRMLGIDGEDLPHVSHYFDEPHRYFRQRLLLVGGRNSAVEAAIRCHRVGATVAISYRRRTFDAKRIKYWLMPEIKMLIDTEKVAFYPLTVPSKIGRSQVELRHVETGATSGVPADLVLLLTGYEMDTALFEMAGVRLAGRNRAPVLDPQSMQTDVPNLFVAGTAAAGTQLRFRLFIENCHPHVDKIVRAITGQSAPFATADKTHSGKYGLPES